MARWHLGRRALLKGTAGATLALPYLEIMGEGKARAADLPARYVVMYGGFSQGRDGDQSVRHFLPTTEGPSYTFKPELSPLGKTARKGPARSFEGFDVQDQVSVVSGLKIPWSAAHSGDSRLTPDQVPPGGRPANFHGCTHSPLLSGTRALAGDRYEGPTSDQIVANEFRARGIMTPFPSLALSVQPKDYYGGSAGTISAKGPGAPNPPQSDPHSVFGQMVSLVKDPTTSSEPDPLLKAARDRGISVLDHVSERAQTLMAHLGREDRDRLNQHFTEIRDLEMRLKTMPVTGGVACQKPGDPGSFSSELVKELPGGCNGMLYKAGWSGEDKRALAMRQLLFTALACDLTRSATFMITGRQSSMNVENLCGNVTNLHAAGHDFASGDEQADLIAWHVEQYAWLVKQLAKTRDVDGSYMIDRTVVLFATEGGLGFDPDSGSDFSNHSTEGISLLVAGGRRLGLMPGRHIKGNDVHPAGVFLRAMQAVGVNKPLGDITEPFSGI